MKAGRKFLASTLLAAASLTFLATPTNAATLTWAGTDSSNSWNYTDKNWSSSSVFASGDNATFSSTATNKNVSIEEAIKAGTVTVSSGSYTFTFSNSGSVSTTGLTISEGASLVIEGSGELTDSSSATIYGTLELSGGNVTIESYVNVYSGGTLKSSGGETTISGIVYVRSGGNLELSGGTISLSSAISNSGTVTVGDNVIFVLNDSLSNGNTYTLIDGSGTIKGWDTLDKSNFLLNGSEIIGHAIVDVGTAGQVTITTGIIGDLVWNGTSSNNAWTNGGDENWLNSGQADAFYTNDNVTFDDTAASKSVSIGEEITAGTITVSAGSYTFTFSSGGSITATSLTINSGAALTYGNNAILTISGTVYVQDGGMLEISGGETTMSFLDISGTLVEISGGNATILNGITVSSYGTLGVSGGTITISGNVDISSNSALEITGGTISLSSAISNSGTVTVGDNVIFVLNDSLSNGNTYTLIDGSGTIKGWDDLDYTNFQLSNGTSLTTPRQLVSSENGVVVIDASAKAVTLTWNGTEDSSAWTNGGDENWLYSGQADAFYEGDSVTFSNTGENKNVSIDEEIVANRISVSGDGYTFMLLDNGSVTSSSLSVSGELKIEGTGSFVTSTMSSLTGTLEIAGGDVTLSLEGNSYHQFEITRGTLKISGGNVAVTSIYSFGLESGGSLEITGGTTTFDGSVTCWSGGGTVKISGGNTTFTSLTIYTESEISGGTVRVTGNWLEVDGTLVISGGTVRVSNSLETFARNALIQITGGTVTARYLPVPAGVMEVSGGSLTVSSTATISKLNDEVIGTLKISGGEVTFNGIVYVRDGSAIEISGGETTFTSRVYVVSSGCRTDFTGGTVSLSSAISNSGTVTVGGDVVFVLNSGLASGNTYTFISGGTVTGWNDLDYKNFQFSDGTSLTSQRQIVSYSTGKVTIDASATAEDLVWNGTASSNVWTTNGENIWLNGDSDDMFYNCDSVTFNSVAANKSVSVVGVVEADAVTVSEGSYTFSLSDGSAIRANSLAINSGASLLLEGSGGLTVSGTLSVAETGTLTLSGTITLSEAIKNSGSIVVTSDVVFALDDLETGENTYTIVSGGTITDWDTLTKSNFSLNGSGLGRSTVNVSVDGQVIIVDGGVADLVWNGTSDNNVWMNDGENIWLLDDGSADAFRDGDSVTFGSDGEKNVSIVGEITAGSVTVSDGEYTFTFSDNASVTASSLTVDDGASLEIEGTGASLMVGSAEISGSFKILEGTTAVDGVLSVSESGALTVEDGVLTANSATIDGILEISGGTVKISGEVDVAGSIEISDGEMTTGNVSVEAGSTLQITGGELIVDGTLNVAETGSLTLDGEITLSSAISNAGTVTVGNNVVFVLDDLETGENTYTVISSGGTIEGWDTLDKSNFMLNGYGLGRATVNVDTNGQVIIIEGGAADLVWNGTSSSNVWTNDGETIWLSDDGSSDMFVSGDNVTFGADGAKTVSVVGAVEARSVTVSGTGYTFAFSDDASSIRTDILTIDSGASLTLTGSGELTTSSATVSGTLEITSGEATITSVEVSSEGTLKISGGTTTADSIDVAGLLELTGGELTVKTIAFSDGSGSFSGGILNISEITGDGSLSFGDGLTVNLYDTTSLSLTSDIALSGSVTFNAEDGETIELSGTLSGSGKLVKDGDGTLTLSGDNTFSGGATISAGTVVAQSDTALGSGSIAIDDGATLELTASGTFSNATSGNGTLSITNNATVSFGSNVGVKTVEVTSGATLSGATTLTHSNAQLVLSGKLALDASAGEQVSFTNGGTVTIKDTATLNLSGISPASVKPLSDSSTLGAGSNITIFSGATVEGDLRVADFLATDSTLSDLADTYAVVYDTSKGLSVMILESGNVSSITSGVRLHDGIGSDFISAIISDDDLDFGTGIKSSDDLQSLSNPIVKALATGNISEASKMMNTLAPDDYAAMVAMPTTSFYNDVKAIDNRLAARHGPLDENARWEFFAQAQGTFIENDDANDTQTFDFDLYGVLAGADYRVNEGLTVGVTVGYDYGKADIHNSGGKIESDDVRITLFAGQQIGEMFFVNAGAQVGYGHYEAKRKTALGDAKGDTDGWNAGVFADVGMMLTLSEELKIAARPYVGLAYLHSEVGSFDDNIFDVDDFHGDSLRASIGCGLFWDFDLAEAAWTVGLDASYSHDFCGDEVDIDATCMSTDKDFGITAKALSKDLFSVGPTVSVGLTKSIDIFAGYAFQAGTDSSTGHNVNAGLKVTF